MIGKKNCVNRKIVRSKSVFFVEIDKPNENQDDDDSRTTFDNESYDEWWSDEEKQSKNSLQDRESLNSGITNKGFVNELEQQQVF